MLVDSLQQGLVDVAIAESALLDCLEHCSELLLAHSTEPCPYLWRSLLERRRAVCIAVPDRIDLVGKVPKQEALESARSHIDAHVILSGVFSNLHVGTVDGSEEKSTR